jgi:hypothetical protein
VGADELLVDRDLHGLADYGNLDLAAAKLGAGPVADTGEADTPLESTLRVTEAAVADGRFVGRRPRRSPALCFSSR